MLNMISNLTLCYYKKYTNSSYVSNKDGQIYINM